jgi:hypothetical protein
MMRWERHVARMGKSRNTFKVLEDLGVDRRKILERILKKMGGRVWNRFMWLSAGQVAVCCEHSGPIKCRDFVHYVRNQKL